MTRFHTLLFDCTGCAIPAVEYFTSSFDVFRRTIAEKFAPLVLAKNASDLRATLAYFHDHFIRGLTL